jgi:chromosome partitioning protein
MYDKRAGACRRVLELLGKKMGDNMFKTIIGIDTRFRDASALGKVVFDVDPECRGAKGYELLANEIVALL